MPKRVSLPPIQQAVKQYLSEGHTYGDICIELNWWKPPHGRKKSLPDVERLQRCLGLLDKQSKAMRSNGTGYTYKYRNKSINYHNAVNIIRAIDRAPVEFDL